MNMTILSKALVSVKKRFSSTLLFYATALTLLTTMVMLAVGVSLEDALRFSVYLWGLLLPCGLAISRQILPEQDSASMTVGLASVMALLLHPITVIPFYVLGMLGTHFGFLLFASSMVWFGELSKSQDCEVNHFSDSYGFWVVCVVSLLIAVICFLAISDMPNVREHFHIQGIHVLTLGHGWPPENPYVAGIPYRDNFGIHLSILAIATATGISAAELGGYGAQSVFLWLSVAALGFVARGCLKLSITTSIAVMISCYLILGYSPINGEYFGSAQSMAAVMTLSPLIGGIGFLLSVLLFSRLVTYTQPYSNSTKLVIALFFVSAATMLSRANAGALLGLAVAIYWCSQVIKTRTLQLRIALYVSVVAGGCFLGLIFSLGSPFSGEISGTKFLRFSATETFLFLSNTPVAVFSKAMGITAVLAGAISYLVLVALNSNFLAPWFWDRTFSAKGDFPNCLEAILFFSVVAGVMFTMATFAPGGSNFVTLQIAKLSMCLIGGVELDRVLLKPEMQERHKVPVFILVFSGILFIFHWFDFTSQWSRLKPFDRLFKPASIMTAYSAPPIDASQIFYKLRINGNTRFIFATKRDALQVHQLMLDKNVRTIVDDEKIHIYIGYQSSSTNRLAELQRINSDFMRDVGKGVLNLPCALALANHSLMLSREVFVLADKGLHVMPHDAAILFAEGRDFVAWRLNLTSPDLKCNSD